MASAALTRGSRKSPAEWARVGPAEWEQVGPAEWARADPAEWEPSRIDPPSGAQATVTGDNDMVVVLQTDEEAAPLPMVATGEHVHARPQQPLRAAVAGLAGALGGLAAPTERYSAQHGRRGFFPDAFFPDVFSLFFRLLFFPFFGSGSEGRLAPPPVDT